MATFMLITVRGTGAVTEVVLNRAEALAAERGAVYRLVEERNRCQPARLLLRRVRDTGLGGFDPV